MVIPVSTCHCGQAQRQRYWARLSGPLLGRIDLQVVMQRLPAVAFGPGGGADDTATVVERVRCARTLMRTRNLDGVPNGQLEERTLLSVASLLPEARTIWTRRGLHQRCMSARSHVQMRRELGATLALGQTTLDRRAWRWPLFAGS